VRLQGDSHLPETSSGRFARRYRRRESGLTGSAELSSSRDGLEFSCTQACHRVKIWRNLNSPTPYSSLIYLLILTLSLAAAAARSSSRFVVAGPPRFVPGIASFTAGASFSSGLGILSGVSTVPWSSLFQLGLFGAIVLLALMQLVPRCPDFCSNSDPAAAIGGAPPWRPAYELAAFGCRRARSASSACGFRPLKDIEVGIRRTFSAPKFEGYTILQLKTGSSHSRLFFPASWGAPPSFERSTSSA